MEQNLKQNQNESCCLAIIIHCAVNVWQMKQSLLLSAVCRLFTLETSGIRAGRFKEQLYWYEDFTTNQRMSTRISCRVIDQWTDINKLCRVFENWTIQETSRVVSLRIELFEDINPSGRVVGTWTIRKTIKEAYIVCEEDITQTFEFLWLTILIRKEDNKTLLGFVYLGFLLSCRQICK